jgi:hypothetical protein
MFMPHVPLRRCMTSARAIAGGSLRALAFLVLAVAYLIWGWSSVLGDFGGDNAVYLLTAQYLSPYAPASDLAAQFARGSAFPPLFPLLLALTGGGESLLTAHIVTVSCLLVAFLLYFLWVREETSSPWAAFAVTACFALLPGTYLQALSVLSENLYLALCITAFFGACRWEKSGKPDWLILSAFAVSAACLTRGAGIALLAAFVAYLWLKRIPRRISLSLISALRCSSPTYLFSLSTSR